MKFLALASAIFAVSVSLSIQPESNATVSSSIKSHSVAEPTKGTAAETPAVTDQHESNKARFRHPFFGFDLKSRDADQRHAPVFRLSELMDFRLENTFDTLCDCNLDSIELGDQMIDLRIEHVPFHIGSFLTAENLNSSHTSDVVYTWVLARQSR